MPGNMGQIPCLLQKYSRLIGFAHQKGCLVHDKGEQAHDSQIQDENEMVNIVQRFIHKRACTIAQR